MAYEIVRGILAVESNKTGYLQSKFQSCDGGGRLVFSLRSLRGQKVVCFDKWYLN